MTISKNSNFSKSQLTSFVHFSVWVSSMMLADCSHLDSKNSNREIAADESTWPKTLSNTRVNRMLGYRPRDYRTQFIDLSSDKKAYVLGRIEFDLSSKNDLESLKGVASDLLKIIESSTSEHPLDGKGKEKAIKEIIGLCDTILLSNLDFQKRDNFDAVSHIQELADSVRSNLEPPIDENLFIGGITLKALRLTSTLPAGTQDNATNVNRRTNNQGTDPYDSSFWQKPAQPISQTDLYYAWGRDSFPDLMSEACVYQDKERGFGTHPRFEVKCGKKDFKVKFGTGTEIGPFNSRIYSALGYHVPRIDFINSIKVAYDRKLLSNFAKRKFNDVKVKLFVIPVHTIRPGTGGIDRVTGLTREQLFNPFLYIVKAELHDGKSIEGKDVQAFLLKDLSEKSFEDDANYNVQNESKIKNLIFGRASLVHDDEDAANVGSWDYDALDHPGRRELRALHAVAAWVGNYDHRRNNTRLQLVKDKKTKSLKIIHQVSDVDSGLGKATFSFASGVTNEFTWTTAERKQFGGSPPGRLSNNGSLRSQIGPFHRIEEVAPFAEMSEEDARWAIRLMSQISEKQITQALIASGYSAAEVIILREKLISRRNSLIHAFQLQNELASSMRSVNTAISYDGRSPVKSILNNGQEVVAPINNDKLLNGLLQ